MSCASLLAGVIGFTLLPPNRRQSLPHDSAGILLRSRRSNAATPGDTTHTNDRISESGPKHPSRRRKTESTKTMWHQSRVVTGQCHNIDRMEKISEIDPRPLSSNRIAAHTDTPMNPITKVCRATKVCKVSPSMLNHKPHDR